MPRFRSDFLNAVAERGYLQDCSDLDGLDALLVQGPVTAYIGFDCTADSLHVGHLIGIMLLRWFQRTGNRPIALMGGGTTKVGDPSGKDESRKLLTVDEINANLEGIRRVFDRYLVFAPPGGGGPTDALMTNNADWLDHLNYISFLRDYGRHFSVNRMLSFDSVKLRLEREQPLSFLEFNYMILQAYDFLELYRRTGCRLQMGGSDQWGNILNGVELGRRTDGAELFALTAPLLTTASGQKMGKTAAGAVWLNTERLPTYDFWQFWRNTEDGDVGRFLRLFTDLPLDEIARLEALGGAEINSAKIVLANAATTLAHGAEAAAAAEATAHATFAEGGIGADLPTITLPKAELEQGIPAFDLFTRAGLCASRGEARRLIKQGGAKLNDGEISNELQPIGLGDVGASGAIKLSAGKKRHALVRPS